MPECAPGAPDDAADHAGIDRTHHGYGCGMSTSRSLLLLLLALTVVLVPGCVGSEDDDDSGDRDAYGSDSTAQEERSEATDGGGNHGGGQGQEGGAEPPAQPDAEAPASGGDTGSAASSFALTPKITACMKRAGYTQDAPPTGGLAAWRHPTGARVVVASGPDVTLGIASEIGTEQQPANVEGNLVIAAVPALTDAAEVCLA